MSNKLIKFTSIIMLVSSSYAFANNDSFIVVPQNYIPKKQVEVIKMAAKKGQVIVVTPSIIAEVCDFSRQINIATSANGFTSASCVYAGKTRKYQDIESILNKVKRK